MKFYQRIHSKLILNFLIVALIPTMIVGWYAIQMSGQALREGKLNTQMEILKSLKNTIENWLFFVQQDIVFLSHSQSLKEYLYAQQTTPMAPTVEMARQAVEQEFLAFSQSRGNYYQVRYLDQTGKEIVRVDTDDTGHSWIVEQTQLQNKSDRYYFVQTMKLGPTEIFVSPLDLNQEHGRIEVPHKPVMRYAKPIFYPEGSRAGIVIVNVLANSFLQTVKDYWLVDANGYYLIHPEQSKRWGGPNNLKTGHNLSSDYPDLAPFILNQATGNFDNNQLFLSFQQIAVPGLGRWTLIVQQPTRKVLMSVITFQIVLTVISGLAIIIALVIVIGISKRIVRPIENLTATVKQIQAGQRQVQVEVIGQDELALLAKGFNAMLEAIRTSEEALQQAKQESESANLAKSRFLASMSHELRTPLNAIIGYGEMLQEEVADIGSSSLSGDIAKIHQAGKHLLSFINDILDISKIEAGKMELYIETFSLPHMINDIIQTIKPLLVKNNHELEVQLSPNLGEMQADLTKIRQIILNLLSNASKFNVDRKVIYLEVLRETETNGNDWILFKVCDNGIGMTPEQKQCVLEIFTQANASTTRKYGGLGLGLAITKYFIQMMGGEIKVDSAEDASNVFTVRLPAKVSTMVNQSIIINPSDDSSLEDGSMVLAIDDDPAVRSLLKRFLTKLGYQVELAESGEEGLRMVKNFLPDIIILDVMMPRMDGWEVLTHLRADHKLANTPIIILSMIEDKNMGYSLGASDYLIKPISREQLSAVLRKYRISLNEENRLIMVVDDDAVTLNMVGRMLRKEGWRVSKADNARKALSYLQKKSPDIILSDLEMPEIDGFEFVGKLHKNYPTVPIIVLTAEDLTVDDRLRLKACHVVTIFQKGVYTREELVNEIRRLLGNSYQPIGVLTAGGEDS